MKRTTRSSSRSSSSSQHNVERDENSDLHQPLTRQQLKKLPPKAPTTDHKTSMLLLKTPNKTFKDEVKRKKLAMKEKNVMSGKFGSVVILSKDQETANDSSNGERTPTPRTPLKNIDPNVLFSPPVAMNSTATTTTKNNTENAPFFSPYLKTPNMAVKSQQVVRKTENSTPIREFKIQKELTKMRVGKLNLFPNVFSSFASTTSPEEDIHSSNDEEEESYQPKQKKRKNSSSPLYHYFNIVMEKCDGELVDLIHDSCKTTSGGKIPVSIAKAISFQLLFALSIAEEIGFQHNDIHERNVLYKKLPLTTPQKKGIAFYDRIDDRDYVWLVDCDFVLKIADYGLSRIRIDDGEEIESGNVFHSEAFNNDLERVKEILTKRIKLDTDAKSKDSKLFSDLKRNIKVGVSAKSLLLHEFFEDIRKDASEDLTPSLEFEIDESYHQYFGAKHPKRKQKMNKIKVPPSKPLQRETPNETPASPSIVLNTSSISALVDSEEENVPVKSRRAFKRREKATK
ncbi:hypothetical protein FDP41_007847 [Naegleria fowleri]|uniref:Protein kinase domain-containing protein n=1 Tax=Naegleria fowleri TaxID=5763 RepID=A0A6A5CAC6_NAEFO|nr:uncharacterized protein FDP41_007847 [Naegleria fowleri]KAF0983932.1 hypothetical protein FDP41_007847 [Naegleria fowleri]CAG4710649.1 unnamed protein product [Naegleria fowleri]